MIKCPRTQHAANTRETHKAHAKHTTREQTLTGNSIHSAHLSSQLLDFIECSWNWEIYCDDAVMGAYGVEITGVTIVENSANIYIEGSIFLEYCRHRMNRSSDVRFIQIWITLTLFCERIASASFDAPFQSTCWHHCCAAYGQKLHALSMDCGECKNRGLWEDLNDAHKVHMKFYVYFKGHPLLHFMRI